MKIFKHLLFQRIPAPIAILYVYTILVGMYSYWCFRSSLLSMAHGILFMMIWGLLTEGIPNYLYRRRVGPQVRTAFLSVSIHAVSRTDGRAHPEMELSAFGSAIRIFVVDSSQREQETLLSEIQDILNESGDLHWFRSVQLIGIEDEKDIRDARKVLKRYANRVPEQAE